MINTNTINEVMAENQSILDAVILVAQVKQPYADVGGAGCFCVCLNYH